MLCFCTDCVNEALNSCIYCIAELWSFAFAHTLRHLARVNFAFFVLQFDAQRYLVRHGLIVEKIGKERKLRHVFLFNDVIVAAKQKVAGRSVGWSCRLIVVLAFAS